MHSSRLGSSMGPSVIMLSLTQGQRVSKKAGGDVPNHKFNCGSGIEHKPSLPRVSSELTARPTLRTWPPACEDQIGKDFVGDVATTEMNARQVLILINESAKDRLQILG